MSQKHVDEIVKILLKTQKVSMLGSFSKKDPFYILISTVLSQRNRDDQTIKVAKRLLSRYKTPEQLAKAPQKTVERLIKQSGFFKVKAARIKEISRILLEKYQGKVPKDYDKLLALPGVGRKTAGCVLVYAFDKPALPVDTHVNRISNRLGWVKTKTPEKTEEALMKLIPKRLWVHINEVLVIHGQHICNPITPKCSICPVKKYCKRVGVSKSK